MAKALFGAGLQGLSGSINKIAGGWTFTKNNVVRRRVIPAQPNTGAQGLFKAIFAFLTDAWTSVLTDPQRIAYNNAGASGDWDANDALTGTSYKPTGRQLFMTLSGNISALLQEATALAAIQPKAGVGSSYLADGAVIADASGGTVVITYGGALEGDESHYITMSLPVSPGNTSLRPSSLRYVMTDNGASPIAAGTDYVAKFGAITDLAGQAIFYKVEAINETTGQRRPVGEGRTIIGA